MIDPPNDDRIDTCECGNDKDAREVLCPTCDDRSKLQALSHRYMVRYDRPPSSHIDADITYLEDDADDMGDRIDAAMTAADARRDDG